MTARKKTSSTEKLSHGVRRKLSLLQLAEELGNVSARSWAFHRDTFYEIRRALQVGVVAVLVEQRRGRRRRTRTGSRRRSRKRSSPTGLERPTYGAQRVANELRLQGVQVSPSGVRGVWLRHGLETLTQRLLRLEACAQE